MREDGQVQGYYWHLSCIYGPPGGLREDDGGEPRRGNFVDRAISMKQARKLDGTDASKPRCHPCLKLADRTRHSEGDTQEYFVVLGYALTADICTCGTTYHRFHHGGDRELIEEIWADAPETEGAKRMDVLVCGDCWYKDNNLPPDERKTVDDPVRCSSCDDPVTEVVVLKHGQRDDEVVDADDLDGEEDPGDYKIVVEWERITQRKEYYTYTITDPDADDLAYIRNGDFDDIAWDVAYENSDPPNVEDYEDMGFGDDGPSAVHFVVRQR